MKTGDEGWRMNEGWRMDLLINEGNIIGRVTWEYNENAEVDYKFPNAQPLIFLPLEFP